MHNNNNISITSPRIIRDRLLM